MRSNFKLVVGNVYHSSLAQRAMSAYAQMAVPLMRFAAFFFALAVSVKRCLQQAAEAARDLFRDCVDDRALGLLCGLKSPYPFCEELLCSQRTSTGCSIARRRSAFQRMSLDRSPLLFPHCSQLSLASSESKVNKIDGFRDLVDISVTWDSRISACPCTKLSGIFTYLLPQMLGSFYCNRPPISSPTQSASSVRLRCQSRRSVKPAAAQRVQAYQ